MRRRWSSAGTKRRAAWVRALGTSMSSARCRASGRIEQPQPRGTLVDDAPAIALCMARVVVGMVGVAPQVAAVRQAGIEVAHAFAVGQEVDARADPHRAADVALQLASCGGTGPRLRHRSTGARRCRRDSASSAPGRRYCGRSRAHCRGRRPCGSPGPASAVGARRRPGRCVKAWWLRKKGCPCVLTNRIWPCGVQPRTSVSGPSQVRRRLGAAFGGHHVDLGVLLVAADVGDPAAVGRQAGRGGLRQPGGQALRRAACGAGTATGRRR